MSNFELQQVKHSFCLCSCEGGRKEGEVTAGCLVSSAERPDTSISKGSSDYTYGNSRAPPSLPRHRLGALVIDYVDTFLDTSHLTNGLAPTVGHTCNSWYVCNYCYRNKQQGPPFFFFFRFLS